ncbi:MAG: hypothetical protein NVSMB63_18350 [Sediminibacterium sp.]
MEKPTIIAAGGLVQNEQQELLMIYRRGKWDLPKGKLDKGENIEDCAVREVMEETGLVYVDRGELIAVSHHPYFDPYLEEEVVKETYWYAMRVKGNQPLIPQAAEDITSIKWVKGKDLEACLADSYDNIVSVVRKAGW